MIDFVCDDGVTLVDTGVPGREDAFAAAFDELGRRRGERCAAGPDAVPDPLG